MHGEDYKLPLVIRCAMGSSFGAGAEHSNCVESLFMHAPGMTVICPTTPADAKGLLKSAIRSDNPILFCEHKQLYQTKGEVPEGDYTIPIGVADVKRLGKDVTVIAVGLMVRRALEAAELLECFQWNSEGDRDAARMELADVLTYAFLLADALGESPHDLIVEKLALTKAKYPVDRAFGKATKYDQL